jgi:hypothetical protein
LASCIPNTCQREPEIKKKKEGESGTKQRNEPSLTYLLSTMHCEEGGKKEQRGEDSGGKQKGTNKE